MKRFLSSTVMRNVPVNEQIFRLELTWSGSVPKAGQFFMLKPKRSGVFLPRPISVAFWKDNLVGFLIQRKGQGTQELSCLHPGEEAWLTGPLGNAWADFLPVVAGGEQSPGSKAQKVKPVALIGGGAGIAPLLALNCELPGGGFNFYAGFKNSFGSQEEKNLLLEPVLAGSVQLVIAAEKTAGSGLNMDIRSGRIPEFLNPENYAAVCACGPEAMLRIVAEKCAAAKVPCYVSLERYMACGAGACLGCTVKTTRGNRRCCADGPVFPASEALL